LNAFSLDPRQALDQVRAERARRAANAAAIESERRLEQERKEKLDHDAEKACAAAPTRTASSIGSTITAGPTTRA
jgi:phage shock protein A